tara:strand:- start:22067 stop:22234 length:168 start_codon:yes stop_codon:yes gene_type:complete
MKGDEIEVGDRLGQIIRIVYHTFSKISTVLFFDGTRTKVDLNEYIWDDEKKVWKK